jgi:uncharacterized membrane protein
MPNYKIVTGCITDLLINFLLTFFFVAIVWTSPLFFTFAPVKKETPVNFKTGRQGMKKRDFYFLGLLVCIVIYAASHRSISEKVDERELKTNTSIKAAKPDSIQDNAAKTIEAGI